MTQDARVLANVPESRDRAAVTAGSKAGSRRAVSHPSIRRARPDPFDLRCLFRWVSRPPGAHPPISRRVSFQPVVLRHGALPHAVLSHAVLSHAVSLRLRLHEGHRVEVPGFAPALGRGRFCARRPLSEGGLPESRFSDVRLTDGGLTRVAVARGFLARGSCSNWQGKGAESGEDRIGQLAVPRSTHESTTVFSEDDGRGAGLDR